MVCGKPIRAHRFSFEVNKHRIAKGQWVLHHCDNPACVNPNHLYAGNNIDNVRDRMVRDRHPGAKITVEMAKEILASSVSNRKLAKHYGVTPSTISRVRTGKHWAALELAR